MNHVTAEGFLDRGLETFRQTTQEPSGWWPYIQAQRTVLARAIALEWAALDGIGRTYPVWINTCWGTEQALQEAVFRFYQVSLPPHGNANQVSLEPVQFMLDFSIWTYPPIVTEPVCLTMESEMYPDQGVGNSTTTADGYSYDFLKLLWAPSPRRIFACTVRGEDRKQTLKNSLESIAATAPTFLGLTDQMLIYILSPNTRHDAIIGLVNRNINGQIDWRWSR